MMETHRLPSLVSASWLFFTDSLFSTRSGPVKPALTWRRSATQIPNKRVWVIFHKFRFFANGYHAQQTSGGKFQLSWKVWWAFFFCYFTIFFLLQYNTVRLSVANCAGSWRYTEQRQAFSWAGQVCEAFKTFQDTHTWVLLVRNWVGVADALGE